jgi:hypothetical protein
MQASGKSRLDSRDESGEARARRYAEIERQAGDPPGAKEMAMIRRAREEDAAGRAGRFLDIARGRES